MENKEVITVTLVLAVVFAILSITTDIAITGSAVKDTNQLSLTFSIITIVLIGVILISVLIELVKFTRKN
ncbi:MAG: hypothetical protein AABW58_03730 [Nanoarchaeota archaeon]